MSDDEAPLDLRSLAAVDESEVVRAALRDFRKRALSRYLWVALLTAAVIVAAFLYPPERSLVDRIEDADDRALVGHAVQVGAATWTLIRVADLGDTLGLEWLVGPDGRGSLSFPTVSNAAVRSEDGRGSLVPFEIEPPADGIVRGTIRVRGDAQPFELDLQALGVPAEYWEGE